MRKKSNKNEMQESIKEVEELNNLTDEEIFEDEKSTEEFAKKEFVRMIRTKEGYQELVKYMGMFPYYNIKNCILIKHQLPDASNVARMAHWNFKGRCINEGQKALKVLIPIMEENYKTNEDGSIQKSKYSRVTGYKFGYVFDISQTNGREIKERELTEEKAEKVYPLLKEKLLKHVIPLFDVYEVDNVNFAETNYNQAKIFINKDLSGIEKVKALVSQTAVCLAKQKYNRYAGLYEDRIIGISVYEAQAISYACAYAMGIPYMAVQVPSFVGMRDYLVSEFESNFSRMKSSMNKILEEYKGVYYELFQKKEKEMDKEESVYTLLDEIERDEQDKDRQKEEEMNKRNEIVKEIMKEDEELEEVKEESV